MNTRQGLGLRAHRNKMPRPFTPPTFLGIWDEVTTRAQYRKIGEPAWIDASGDARLIPDVGTVVHTVHLNNLDADTNYEFRVSDEHKMQRVYLTIKEDASNSMVLHWHTVYPLKDNGYAFPVSDDYLYKFSTLPKNLNEKNIKVVFLSDMHRGGQPKLDMLEIAMDNEAELVVMVGDWTYVDGLPDGWDQTVRGFVQFWDNYMNKLIGSDGKITPIMGVFGNHDVKDHFHAQGYDFVAQQKGDGTSILAAQFANLRDSPYYSVDLGDEITLVGLDSEHSTGEIVAGDAQETFLSQTLTAKSGRKHVVPYSHVAFFTSHRRMSGTTIWSGALNKRQRDSWLTLIQKQESIKVCFAGHDHCYKKTHPLDLLEFTVDTTESQVNSVGHGLDTGSRCVVFSTDTLPGGLTDNIANNNPAYWVRKVDNDTMTLHNSESDAETGSNPISFSSDGTGTHKMFAISNNGLMHFGDGPTAVTGRDPWNPATTWYLDKVIGNEYQESEIGEVHLDDGENAYDSDVRNETQQLFAVTFKNNEIQVDSINAFGTIHDTWTKII